MISSKEIEDRYIESRQDLKKLVAYAHELSSELKGKEAGSESIYYASIIFSKLIGHGITLSRNSPIALEVSDFSGAELWDVSSVCCIARAILESFDALAYIAIHPNSKETELLRIKVWELHDIERRLKMLNFINSDSTEARKLTEDSEQLRSHILDSPSAKLIHRSLIGKIRKGESPDYLSPIRDRCKNSEIDYEYYMGAKVFLSSHVHTYPFSVHQLSRFRAGDADSLNLISLALRYSSVFVAKAIQGIRLIIDFKLCRPTDEVEDIIRIWIGIAKNGVQSPTNN